jgi:hypothetical protein
MLAEITLGYAAGARSAIWCIAAIAGTSIGR